VAGFQRTRREGDHAAAFVADGKHYTLAKAVVERTLRAVALFLGAEETGGTEGFVVGHAAQTVAQRVEAVGRVADAEGLDAFRRQTAASQILARYSAFGRAQLLFKPCGSRFVQIQELRSLTCFGSLLRGGELPLGQGNSALACHDADRFGERDVLDLGNE